MPISPLTRYYRGIASFLSAYEGTQARTAKLRLKDNVPPDFGIGVYINGRHKATVLLDAAAGDTRQLLEDKLPTLYKKTTG